MLHCRQNCAFCTFGRTATAVPTSRLTTKLWPPRACFSAGQRTGNLGAASGLYFGYSKLFFYKIIGHLLVFLIGLRNLINVDTSRLTLLRGWTIRFRSAAIQRDFLLVETSRPALGHSQPPVQRVSHVLPVRYSVRAVQLTSHLCLGTS